MWSWLQKLMNSLRDPEQEDRVHTPAASTTRQLQIRTKSIYPRERAGERQTNRVRPEKERKFRFPVIPDKQPNPRKREAAVEERKPISNQKQEPIQKRQDSFQTNQEAFHNQQSLQRKQESALKKEDFILPEKQTYTPTEVLSPIYGKIKPEQQERPSVGKHDPLLETDRLSYSEENRSFEQEEWRSLNKLGLLKQERRRNSEVTEQTGDVKSSSDGLQSVEQSVLAQSPGDDEYIQESVGEAEEVRESNYREDRALMHESAAPQEVAAGYEPETDEHQTVTEQKTEAGFIEENRSVEEIILSTEESLSMNTRWVNHAVTKEAWQEQNVEESLIEQDESIGRAVTEHDGPTVRPGTEHVGQSASPSVEHAEQIFPSASEHAAPSNSLKSEEAFVHAESTAPAPEPRMIANWAEGSPVSSAQTQRTTFSFAHEEPAPSKESKDYVNPSVELLNPSPVLTENYYEYTLEQKQLLEETLANFNVSAQVVGIVKGPAVTRFELQPAPGVKVNKITSLTDDIKLNLAAKDIRIEAPIPGRNAVGIEVPNIKSEPIFISRIIGSDKFREHPSPLAIALGMDIGGEPIVADIKKMPHGLIAGSTGSGKSVCINSIIVSLLYKATPEQVRLLLIDPKMVELAPYNHLPHLVTPVVTDAKQATAALKWAVEEMEKRYALFVDAGVRDIDRYNQTTDEPLPFIVIIIDELADLMMVSPQDVEDCIIRIAQKARACGIHLLLATQRPSVDVITGNIKANVPTRLAFAVFSQVDSRTILDQTGAERLLGRGDMLFLESGATPLRLQGNYVSDDEIERITQMIKKQRKPEYFFSKEELEQSVQSYDMGDDSLYHEALVFVADQGQASASALQRRFRIGYNRAARLIEMMESQGHVAGQMGGKPRAVLITPEDAQALAEGTSLI